MDEQFILFTALIVITVLISLIIAYYMKTKNQERLRMIDKGINPDGDLNNSELRKRTNLKKNGVLFISFGIGLLIAQGWVNNNQATIDSFITYLTTMLIFGGIGFLINYRITKNSSKH